MTATLTSKWQIANPLALRERLGLKPGQIFKAYRRAGGPRTSIISDFRTGAPALMQADRRAAVDRGYLRTYFPELTLLSPSR
jgi:bifunctional DNA-binding transcriptional regulator/antitoxin component of YhaV-PrlF toxin-antitoxin module